MESGYSNMEGEEGQRFRDNPLLTPSPTQSYNYDVLPQEKV